MTNLYFPIFPRKQVLKCQIPFLGKKNEKCFTMSTENFTHSAKHWNREKKMETKKKIKNKTRYIHAHLKKEKKKHRLIIRNLELLKCCCIIAPDKYWYIYALAHSKNGGKALSFFSNPSLLWPKKAFWYLLFGGISVRGHQYVKTPKLCLFYECSYSSHYCRVDIQYLPVK